MNFKNIVKVSFFTFLSRILGLIRDILMARYLGASLVSDAFFVAFKIPNLFRRFFAEGSMQSAFVPIFSRIFFDDKTKAKQFSNQIFTLLLLSLLFFTIIMEIFAPYVIRVISPGFYFKGVQVFDLTVFLLRVMLPYLVFVSLAAFYSSILNTLGKFSIAAFLPAFLNIFMITFLLLGKYCSSYAYMTSWGVLIGGVAQALIVAFICYKKGWLPSFTFRLSKLMLETKAFFKKIIPVVLGAGVYQVNIVVDVIAASLLPAGSISYLFYADRIYQLPLAIIGIAIGTVILPFVSAKNKYSVQEVLIGQEKSLLMAWGISMPAALGLIIMAIFIIPTIFYGGNFDLQAVKATAFILAIYSISLPFNVLIKIMLPLLYANGDTKTPFYSTLVCLLCNLVLVFTLAYYFSYYGIALSTTISSIINYSILKYILHKKHKLAYTNFYFVEFKKLIAISVVFGLILSIIFVIMYNLHLDYNIFFRLLIILIVLITIIIFIILLKIFKSFLYEEIFSLVRKKNAIK